MRRWKKGEKGPDLRQNGISFFSGEIRLKLGGKHENVSE
jgi:hypothetical protein